MQRGDGFQKMKQLFIKNKWDVSIQSYFYTTFMVTNRKDTQHGNFKDFYIYWEERLQGLNVGDEHLLEHFQDMLLPRAAAKLDVRKVNTLKKFNSFIKSLDDRELQWYNTKSVNSLEKRKMLLQKKKESKKGGTGNRSYPVD